MADFAELKNNLTRLTTEMRQRLPGALTGRPNDESEADRRSAELGNFADRLILLRRDLKSHEHLVRMQPRDARSPSG